MTVNDAVVILEVLECELKSRKRKYFEYRQQLREKYNFPDILATCTEEAEQEKLDNMLESYDDLLSVVNNLRNTRLGL